MFRSLVLGVGLLLVLSTAGEAKAQQRVPNYSRRPTVSPFINLFNSNQGGVNNYFSFVRPLQQQARINQQQFNQNARLQRQIQQGGTFATSSPITLGVNPTQGMLRPGVQGTGTPSTAASFMNYSHFYPVPQGRTRR